MSIDYWSPSSFSLATGKYDRVMVSLEIGEFDDGNSADGTLFSMLKDSSPGGAYYHYHNHVNPPTTTSELSQAAP